jgi:hypothetical protein
MIVAGIIKNPMFGNGTPPAWAMLVPALGPMRAVVDASFATQQHLGSDLGLRLWVRALAIGVAVVFAAISTMHQSRGAPCRSPTR